MNQKAHLAGLGFAMIFGFSFLFSKVALQFLSPIALISYRFLLAFFVFEGLRRAKVIRIRFSKQLIKSTLPVAIFQPVLYFLFETYGLGYTSSGEAGMMIALIPIFVTVFSIFILKEKPSLVQGFFILLSIGGILFIQLNQSAHGFESFLGLLLLFLAVIAAALFNIASRKASITAKPMETTYMMMLIGAIVFQIIYLMDLAIHHHISDYVTNLGQIDVLAAILYLGIVASIGGFFLVNYALSELPAHVSSIYSNLSTIVAVIAGALILKESILWYHYIGGFLIVSGVYGTVWFGQRHLQIRTEQNRLKLGE